MEFKSLTNIESSFRRIRLMLAVFTGCCALITGYALWSSYRFAEKQREKIYVLDKGKSLMLALSQDLSQNRPAEAREHVRRFHELFFSLSPQKDAIEHNIGRALQLADKSAYHYYVDFAEKGYYNRLISGNINQVVHVDSVVCDFAAYPYKARTYARQLIIRESNVTERSLVTSCSLQNTGRSDDNPNGFIIEQFTILENRGYKECGTMRGKPAVLKRADSRIWLFCRRLTGKQRIVLTSVVSLLFTAACLYSVVSSVSRLGERKGDMKTGHIRPVMLRPETTTIHSNIQKHENGLSENQGTAGAVE